MPPTCCARSIRAAANSRSGLLAVGAGSSPSTAAVVVGSVAVGFILAGAWGERSAGQEMTGLTPGDESRILLTNARDAMGQGDFNSPTRCSDA